MSPEANSDGTIWGLDLFCVKLYCFPQSNSIGNMLLLQFWTMLKPVSLRKPVILNALNFYLYSIDVISFLYFCRSFFLTIAQILDHS